MTQCDVLVVAGEASGDLHAARLLAALRRRRPDVRAFGLGGDELRAAGMETLADSSEIAVVGLIEVLKILRRAREIFYALLAEVDRRGARFAILVDSPDFNLRLARELKRRGVHVVYYVSPQIWAWRRGRVKTIGRRVDLMLVLFGFEEAFYREHGVRALHVGHPLVDEVQPRPQAWDRPRQEGEPFRIALLPGSRRSEVAKLLPPMLGAMDRLRSRLPIELRLVRAPGLSRELLEGVVAAAPMPVEIVESERLRWVADSHLAVCASGTATLEVGLLGTPEVVVYRLARWSWWAAQLLVDIEQVSLVNLVLGSPAVPELLQDRATPEGIAAECERLLRDPAAIAAMRQRLSELRPILGAAGASERAAEAVAGELERCA